MLEALDLIEPKMTLSLSLPVALVCYPHKHLYQWKGILRFHNQHLAGLEAMLHCMIAGHTKTMSINKGRLATLKPSGMQCSYLIAWNSARIFRGNRFWASSTATQPEAACFSPKSSAICIILYRKACRS